MGVPSEGGGRQAAAGDAGEPQWRGDVGASRKTHFRQPGNLGRNTAAGGRPWQSAGSAEGGGMSRPRKSGFRPLWDGLLIPSVKVLFLLLALLGVSSAATNEPSSAALEFLEKV